MRIIGWTTGSGPDPVPEFNAGGEIERVYHEVRQSLQVTAVPLLFRTWAAFDNLLPALWDELRPNLETRIFEKAADQIRQEAVRAARTFRLPDSTPLALGESRAWQVRSALALYHHINPKLLLIISAVSQALHGERIGARANTSVEKLQRGGPLRMYPMELEEEKPAGKVLRRLFKDIRKTLSLPRILDGYRTLGLWPDYLSWAWNRCKPIIPTPEFQRIATQIRERARSLPRTFPFPISLTFGRIKELGCDAEQVAQTIRQFEQLLPALILNIAVMKNDCERAEASGRAPNSIPVEVSGAAQQPAWRAFQKRQRLVELGDRFVSFLDEGSGDPVVLLHGIPTWSFLWRETIPALNDRHRLLVPDLLGFGYSDKRDCFDRSIAVQADMIDAFLDKLGLQSAHFIGHDIGGGVALRLAAFFPHRVRSLCLLNTVCYDSWPIDPMFQWGAPGRSAGFSLLHLPSPARRKLSSSQFLKSLRQDITLRFAGLPGEEWLEGLLAPWRTETGKLSLVRDAVALNTNHTVELTPLLSRIAVPTLILWGEDDQFLPVKYAQRLTNDIPGANLVRIAGARHFLMVDQPSRVHPTIREFLSRQLAAPQQAAA